MNKSNHHAAPVRGTAARVPLASAASVLVLALSLSACQTDPAATGSIAAAYDYRQRHPIVLAEAPRHLDVFVGGAYTRLDPRQRQDVSDFASEYLRSGKSGMIIAVPKGVRYPHNVERTLMAVRQNSGRVRRAVGRDLGTVLSPGRSGHCLADPAELRRPAGQGREPMLAMAR